MTISQHPIVPESENLATPARRFYRPELDALRFFAFLCVFFFHRMDYLPLDGARHPVFWNSSMAGAFGVPIFFLLSSYLIVELLLRERQQTGRVHLGAFYTRRILRIWPLYFFAFYGLSILGRFIPNVGPKPGAWIAFTFFLGNWFILRHGWMSGSVDPLWSIAVEEQFYICAPWIVARGGRRWLAATGAIVLLIAYGFIAHVAHARIGGETALWCNSFFQFQFFAAGALLALALHGRKFGPPMWTRLLLPAAGYACWYFAVSHLHVKSYYLPADALPSTAEAILGWALVLLGCVLFFLAPLGLPARWVPRPLVYLGRISYGLYVFHSFVFFLLLDWGRKTTISAMSELRLSPESVSWSASVLVLAATIGLAVLSYRFLELPFLKLKRRFTYVPSRPE